MPLTKEEAMKQKLPEHIIKTLDEIGTNLGIKHNKMREAFIDVFIDPSLDHIIDFKIRCDVAFYNMTSKLPDPNKDPNRVMHFRDMYAYPIPIERELVLGYVIIETKYDSGSCASLIDTRTITSENNICCHGPYGYGDSVTSTDNNPIELYRESGKRDIYKGFTSAPFPTYQIAAYINGKYTILGYEHPTLVPPDWTSNIVSRIRELIDSACDEVEKAELKKLIKDF